MKLKLRIALFIEFYLKKYTYVIKYVILSVGFLFFMVNICILIKTKGIHIKTKLLLLTILISLGVYSQSPGGVPTTNMSLWFSGDTNVMGEASGTLNWGDQSGSGFDAYQATAADKPIRATLFNYNETFTFDGASDYLAIKTLNYAAPAIIEDLYAFVVYKTTYTSASFNSNWAFIDFDRSNAYDVYVQGNGALGMSYLDSGGIVDNAATTVTNNNVPHIGTFIFDHNLTTHTTQMKVDGKLDYDVTVAGSAIDISGTRYGFIGDGSEAGSENGGRNNIYFDGDIAEIILFDKGAITTAEVLKIESYLALKYGITLDISNTTYKDSNNTTIWDNVPYWNNIAGIIRDDSTGSINQKIASSVDTDLIVATTNNYLLPNSDGSRTPLPNDCDYVLFGDNDGGFGYDTFDGGTDDILKKKWLFEVGGGSTTQNVHIAMPIAFFPPTSTAVQLIISTDDVFTTSDALSISSTNGDYYYWNVNITDQDRISFVVTGVGERIAGIVPSRFDMVLRADRDLTAGGTLDWLDATPYNADGFQGASARVPASSEFMNFNPTLTFDGGSDVIAIKNKHYTTGDQIKDLHSFVVYSTDYNTVDTNPNFDNWAFLDFDRSEAYNMYIRPTGELAFSYQSNGTKDLASASLGNDGLPHIAEFKFDADLVNETFMKFDGNIEYNSDLTGNNIVVRTDRYGFIGDGSEAGSENGGRNNIYFDGKISEVILADKESFTATETIQIESYLAIKYGVTLTYNATLLPNYLNSVETVIWNNTDYWNGIAGIIKDEVDGDLDQRIAESSSAQDIILSTNTDFVSPNSDLGRPTLTEGTSLLYGNNSLSTGYLAFTGGGGTALDDFITLRKWYFHEAGGDTGSPYIAIPKSYFPVAATEVRILISSDDVFTGTGDTVAPMLSDADNYYYSYNVADGDRIAFVFELPFVPSPGSIETGLNMWLKADNNVTSSIGIVTAIGDSSLGGNGASQGTNLDKPTNVTLVNYNPIITFDGSRQHLAIQNLNYNTVAAIPKLYSWVVYESDFTGVDNSSFYDFDKDEYFNTSIGGDGKLEFSYTTSGGTFNNEGITETNDGRPKIGGFIYDTALGANETMIRLNGAIDFEGDVDDNGIGTGTSRFGYVGDGSNATIFDGGNTADYYNGKIAEIIQYEGTTLASEDIQRIESYLGIKYGVTLDNTAGGTVGDYIDSDETVIWDASTNSDYHQNIAGIGLDESSVLYQKQAISTAENSVLTISKGATVADSNENNTGIIATDHTFLMWGSKSTGGVLGETPSFRIECGQPLLKVNRDWKIQTTGSIGTVTLQFDMEGITLPGGFDLVIDTDGNGDYDVSGLIINTSGVLSGDNLTFTGVTLDNGVLFTLVRKGDYDITYNGSWSDESGARGEPTTGDIGKRITINSSVTVGQNFICDCLKVDVGQVLTIPTDQYVNTGELILGDLITEGDLYLEGTSELIQTTATDSNSGIGNIYKILGEATESLYRYNYFSSPVHT